MTNTELLDFCFVDRTNERILANEYISNKLIIFGLDKGEPIVKFNDLHDKNTFQKFAKKVLILKYVQNIFMNT